MTEQLQQFDREGYLVVRNVLDNPTISKLIEAGDRLIASDRTLNRQRRHDGRYDGFRNAITLDDAFIPLLTHPIILPIVVQLLGANLQLTDIAPDLQTARPTRYAAHAPRPGWHRDYLQAMNDLGHFSIPRLELKCAYCSPTISRPNTGATMMVPGSNQLKNRGPPYPKASDPWGPLNHSSTRATVYSLKIAPTSCRRRQHSPRGRARAL
ncbi:MAG: phytanoyl-CoA dioxygenase family protein [Caldilineaceae bacterium]